MLPLLNENARHYYITVKPFSRSHKPISASKWFNLEENNMAINPPEIIKDRNINYGNNNGHFSNSAIKSSKKVTYGLNNKYVIKL